MLVKRNRFNITMFYAFNEGEGDGSGGAGGETVTPPVVEAPPVFEAPPSAFAQSIPSEYQNEPYIQNLLKSDSPETELWKQFAGLQKAIGTRPGGMPADDAPDEDWQKWTSAVQPQDISVYGDIKPTLAEGQEHLKDMIDASYSPEFTTEILEAARSAGIAPKQFQQMASKFNAMQIKAAESFAQQAQQQSAELDVKFDQMLTKEFGQDKSKVLEVGTKFIKEHLSSELQQSLMTKSNEELVAVAAAIYKAHKVYGKEDSIPSAGQGAGYVANDVISLKAEIQKAMTDNDGAFSNQMSNHHAQQVHRVNTLSAQLAKLTKPRAGY